MQSTDDKTHTKAGCDAPLRRRWLAAAAGGLAGWAGLSPGLAAASPSEPLRLACDRDVQSAGVAPALLRGFSRDTGLAVRLEPGGALDILEWTESGRCDAVLAAAPSLAAPWVDQGLLHGRRAIAALRWVLVGPLGPAGPAPRAGSPPARGARSTDVLASLQAMASEPDSQRRFLRPGQPTAGRWLADALWTQAGLGHDLPGRAEALRDDRLAEEARDLQAYAIAGAWSPQAWAGSAGQRVDARPAWGLLAEHDPRLRQPVEVMRSFRSQHPAARLFSDWITGPSGRRALARLPGVLPASP